MRIKEHWRQEAFIRSAKAQSNSPTMIIQLPVAMADTTMYPGADRTVLASVYILDGKAIVVPATRRCGILVVEWSKLMRHLRRRHKGNAWEANVKERFEVYSTETYRNYPNAVPAGRYARILDAIKHAESVTYKMGVVDTQAESRGFVYCNWIQEQATCSK